MPFMNDHSNWNRRWEDEMNNLPEAIDDMESGDGYNIVTYDIPETTKTEEPVKEKDPPFETEGKIPIIRAPYYAKEYIYSKKEFQFQPGVTILVGCNGSGKTTLINQMHDFLKSKKVPVLLFDNLRDGGSHARAEAAFHEDFAFLATSMASSEGENVVIGLNSMAKNLKEFIDSGIPQGRGDKLTRAFARAVWGDEVDKQEQSNERWLLFDAIDSGLSIDNIIDIKQYLFETILKYAGDKKIYIVCSCNSFEMARAENCMDIRNGQYFKCLDYEGYRRLILASRKVKDKRYNKNA